MIPLLLLMSISWCIVCGYIEEGCPPQENIAPACICKNLGNGPMMLCSNVMNPEELIPPIKATDNKDMFSLGIIDSSLMYIPSKLFTNTNYKKIRFANSQIMALSDSDLAFEGLEDHLEEIRATDAAYITTWDWSQLRKHRRLEHIDIHMISMYSLDQQFPELPTLKFLGISKAEISFIHPEAFQKLENLLYVVLEDNEIAEMNRKMFPKTAESLTFINLNNNLLDSLPDDMFTNMPNLKEVHLNNNKFFTMKEETFLWPLENLEVLNLKGNEFRCDCRLRWMINIVKPSTFEAYCVLPDHLIDLPLKNINNKVLYC